MFGSLVVSESSEIFVDDTSLSLYGVSVLYWLVICSAGLSVHYDAANVSYHGASNIFAGEYCAICLWGLNYVKLAASSQMEDRMHLLCTEK